MLLADLESPIELVFFISFCVSVLALAFMLVASSIDFKSKQVMKIGSIAAVVACVSLILGPTWGGSKSEQIREQEQQQQESQQFSEKMAVFSQLQSAQQRYYSQQHSYSASFNDLRFIEPQLNKSGNEFAIELQSGGQGYYAETELEDGSYSITVADGQVIDRSCQDDALACVDNTWRAADE